MANKFLHVSIGPFAIGATVVALLMAGCAASPPAQTTPVPGGDVSGAGNQGGTAPEAQCTKFMTSDPTAGKVTSITCPDGDGLFTATLKDCGGADSGVLYYQAMPQSGQVQIKLVGGSQTLVDRTVSAADGSVLENVNGNGSDSYLLTVVRSQGFTGAVVVGAPCGS